MYTYICIYIIHCTLYTTQDALRVTRVHIHIDIHIHTHGKLHTLFTHIYLPTDKYTHICTDSPAHIYIYTDTDTQHSHIIIYG